MGRVIAVVNQKGGVGKTTTVINLGAALAERQQRTLLIDLDPQAALSNSFGLQPDTLEHTIYNVLTGSDFPLAAVIHPVRPFLDLVPANIDLAAAEAELVSALGREYLLRDALEDIRQQYAFVLIDCGPNLGLLTINALTAADEVLIPIICEFLAMRAMGMLIQTISRVKKRLNPQLRVLGILGTMYDPRTIHTREVLDELRSFLGEKVFDIVIRKSIRFAEAPAAHQPILEYASSHPGAQAYRDLAEVIIHGEEKHR
ncbi:MAG: AAA family ATPase [Anaerolineae bacterium]|nr:AAA family ATPase [Anaerolineae bacterium]